VRINGAAAGAPPQVTAQGTDANVALLLLGKGTGPVQAGSPLQLPPYTVATFIGLLPAHIIYCWIGARLNELLQTNPDPDFQALFGQFRAPMAGVFVLAVVLPFGLKGLQRALARKAPE
jgi:hypothetical protein